MENREAIERLKCDKKWALNYIDDVDEDDCMEYDLAIQALQTVENMHSKGFNGFDKGVIGRKMYAVN